MAVQGDLLGGVESPDTFFQAHQRDFNRLQDPDRSVRRAALDMFNKKLAKPESGASSVNGTHLEALCSAGLLPPFLHLLSDPVEKCRELAVGIIGGITSKLPQVDGVIDQIVPAVRERIGVTPVLETSEEVRLQLVDLVADHLLPKCAHVPTASTAQDIATVLSQALHDPYHEIKKAACRGIVAGAQQCPTALAPHADLLLKSLLHNVAHPHSRVRTAILQGLDAIVSTGGLPAGSITDVLSQGIKPLAFDKASNVRQLLFSSIAHWLGAPPTLSPSASPAAGPPFDPHPYVLSLLPLLLAGVTDPSPEVATRSLELVEHVGRQLAEPPDTGNAMAVDQAADCRTGGPENGHSGPSEQSARGGWRGPPLPPPYKGRPGSGIQRVVGMHLAELLRPLQRELREWTVASRQRAARVLHTVLVMGGETITSHVDVIVPILCAAVGDEDADVAQLVVSCGHVVGAVVAPQAWVPLMGDELTAARATSAQKANRLVILASLLHASQQGGLSVEHVALIGQLAVGDELRCSEHGAVRAQLLAVVTNLVRVAGPACTPVSQPLLNTLLQLQSTLGDAPLQRSAAAVTAELARVTGHPSLASLYSQHVSALMAAATADHAHWTAAAPGLQLFQTLLRAAGEAAGPVLESALPVLAATVQQEREPALRISMLQLVDELLESPPLGPFWSPLAPRLLTELLVPCGVWRAGKVAAAVRHAAMVATGTLLRRDLCSQAQLLDAVNSSSLLAVVRSCLEEDYYVDTRRAACHVMEQVIRIAGPALSEEQKKALNKDLLKRLDDSNDDIRVEITKAARLLFASLPPDADAMEFRQLVDALLVHMDDSDARVQNAVCSVLEIAAKAKGDQVKEAVLSVQKRHRSQVYCQRVLSAANGN